METDVAAARRRDDPEHTDHRGERRFDWREMAPRWVLVTTIAALLGSTGYLWGKNSALYDSRMELLAKYQSDGRWDLLTKHTTDINELQRTVTRHQLALDRLASMAEDVRVTRRLAERDAERAARKEGR